MICWDLRSKSKVFKAKTEADQLSVDWNRSESHLLLTGSKDGRVHVWDARKVEAPLKSLIGHQAEVVHVKWCPSTGEVTHGSLSPLHFVASACTNGQTILWNMEAKPSTYDDGEAPEVLFIHSAHSGPMNDFDLAPLDDFLFCSVAEDSFLQLWQPTDIILEEEEEPCESAPKRQRNEAETR
eukprot:Skav207532  [mRNA]  locus=scaffold756:86715:87260:- [translate_table: standard]